VAAAEGGTLFLDEIGEIPLSDQVKLLRLLETRRYRQVGSNEWQEADFRLVCATNKDLATMVSEGTFREDLYYRLNVFEIELPPLRDSIEDLPVLIDTILKRLGATGVSFASDAMACLQGYAFPGNVRELRNIVERSILLADDGTVHRSHLPSRCLQSDSTQTNLKDQIVSLEEAERNYLQSVLRQHTGSRQDLASRLGIGERVLYRKIAELRSREH
jgi:two-component system response regulator HydG